LINLLVFSWSTATDSQLLMMEIIKVTKATAIIVVCMIVLVT